MCLWRKPPRDSWILLPGPGTQSAFFIDPLEVGVRWERCSVAPEGWRIRAACSAQHLCSTCRHVCLTAGNPLMPLLGFPSPVHPLLPLLSQVSDVGSFCWLWIQSHLFFFFSLHLLKLQAENELKLPVPSGVQKNLKDVRTRCTHESPTLSAL